VAEGGKKGKFFAAFFSTVISCIKIDGGILLNTLLNQWLISMFF
jgi:hypothetical protein